METSERSLAMATAKTAKHGFDHPNFSWSAYDQYRPTYPQSLWSLIVSCYDSDHQAYNSALDLGCGSGAASAILAHHFSRITLADPFETIQELHGPNSTPKTSNPAFLARATSCTMYVTPKELQSKLALRTW